MIADDFKHGKNLTMGQHCIIEPDVIIGENVKLGHFVTLKSGTRFGNNVNFADYCKTTGLCYLGNNVNVRTDATISKSVIIEDCAFIGPGVMTNHTKHVAHMRPNVEETQLITKIGYGAIIGSMASIVAGISIGDNVIIGANGVVTKNIMDSAIYVGNPLRKMSEIPPDYVVNKPDSYKEYSFNNEMIKRYLPHYK